MAEATDITVTPLQGYAGKSELLVEAKASTDETITLNGDNNNEVVTTIKAVSAHVAATGAALQVSYATNVLTLETAATTDALIVVRVLYE